MLLKFRHLATGTALLFWALAVVWMFAPADMLTNWGVGFSEDTELVSRRAAALYLGIGVMFFLARNCRPSPARSALVTGLIVTCLTLAALGLYEWLAGHARVTILAAVFIEALLSLVLLYVQRAEGQGQDSIPAPLASRQQVGAD